MPAEVEQNRTTRAAGAAQSSMPDFLIHWQPVEPQRALRSAAGSIAAHVAVLIAVWVIGLGPAKPARRFADAPRIEMRQAVTLVTPKDIIVKPTQKAPNSTKPPDEVDLAGLTAPPTPQPQRPTAPVFRPPTPQRGAPVPPQPAVIAPEPPKLEVKPAEIAQGPMPALGTMPGPNPPPVQPPPRTQQEKPKLAFESIGAQMGTPRGTGQIAAPKNSMEETVKGAMQRGPGGVAVGDQGAPGAAGMPNLSSSPSRQSNLELLSDPQGVDFKPYLVRVLAIVRRNWFAVLPESARMGQRGRTVIQFLVNRDGTVPKLVIAGASGSEPLDRAAVAGISASAPLPALPAEFKGQQVQLQLAFSYNMPTR